VFFYSKCGNLGVPSLKIPAAKKTFGRAFRTVRVAKGKTQEDFVQASGRTHVSMLERSVNAPTLTTIEGLASELNVHPLTLVVLTYAKQPTSKAIDPILELVKAEVAALDAITFAAPRSRSRSSPEAPLPRRATAKKAPRTRRSS
jgi:transcriptional regulator with XRE-family HTH domain